MDVVYVPNKHKAILMNSFWEIFFLVKEPRNSKWNRVHKKRKILTACARMHSRKIYPESDMHVACVQKKLSNLDQPFLRNPIFKVNKSEMKN